MAGSVQRTRASAGWIALCVVAAWLVVAPQARAGSLAAGDGHTCAVRTDGTVACWGASTPPEDLGAATAIAAGDQHTCAIKPDSTVACWDGAGAVPDELGTVTAIAGGGDGTCAIQTAGTVACWGGAHAVPDALGTAVAIAVGDDHACAIRTDRGAACWGADDAGQSTVPPGLGTIAQIAAGGDHTCAVKTDGTAICWGDDEDGESSVPAGLGTVRAVAAGDRHTCAIRTDGTVACWGQGNAPPDGLGTVTEIAAGGGHTCAVRTAGTVTCWGDDAHGQSTVPADLGTVSRRSLTLGWNHTCAIDVDGLAVCYGIDGYGQTHVPDGLGTVTAIAAGSFHSCAIKTDSTVECWGADNSGQSDVPPSLGTVTAISAGAFHTCAIRTDGTAACWGEDGNGQRSVPDDLGPVAAIAAGGFHTCALRVDGTARCWGYDFAGQSSVPPALGTVTDITAGWTHSCARTTAGAAVCWGDNYLGQSGVPAGLGTVRAVVAGADHTCAIRTAGTVACWGENGSMQSSVPGDLGTVTSLAAGFSATCAVATAGRARCWGFNNELRLRPPPDGVLGYRYDHVVPAGAQAPAAELHVAGGTLPPGLELSSAGVLSGTPTEAGRFTFTVEDDGVFASGHEEFTVEIAPFAVTSGSSASAPVKGDFNGDGYADLAVGARAEDVGTATDAGAVHVLYGSASGPTATGSQVWTQATPGVADAPEAGDGFGAAVAVGDVNGDSYADLAIGAPGENTRAGAVHVLYGGAEGLTATGSQRWTQDSPGVPDTVEANDFFGATLAIGNAGKSAARDLAVGAPGEDVGEVPDAGAVHVLYGGTGGLTGAGSQQWSQGSSGVADAAERSDRFGSSLAMANLGWDPRADLVVGTPEEDLGVGAVQVLYGGAAGLSSTHSQFWTQAQDAIAWEHPEPGDHFGAALAAADFGNGGYADVAVGVPGEDLDLGGRDAGAVTVLYGGAGGLSDAGSQFWRQDATGILDIGEPGDHFGAALAAGNVGGGSQADLVVGAPDDDLAGGPDAGVVHVIYGGADGLSDAGNQRFTQSTTGIADTSEGGDRFGASLAAANYGGNGFGDLAIGVPGEDVGAIADAGGIQVLFGTKPGVTDVGNRLWTQNSAGIADIAETGDGLGGGLGR